MTLKKLSELDCTTRLDMICVCEDKGKLEAKENYDRFTDLVFIEPETFLTTIVASLEWNYGCSIIGIYTDIWSVVKVQRYKNKAIFSCECDRVEDGLIAIWLYLHDTNQYL